MKQFSHKVKLNTQVNVVGGMKRKINRQSTIFSIIFASLVIIVAIYLSYNLVVNRYDGRIVCKNVQVNFTEDILIAEYYVKPGDVVREGDTLFSFIYVNWLQEAANPNIILAPDIRSNDAKLRSKRLISQLALEMKSADSLSVLIDRIKDEVNMGLITTQELDNKKWDYNQMLEQIKHTQRLIDIEQIEAISSDYDMPYLKGIEPAGYYTYKERLRNKLTFGKAFKYKRAFVDMRIVELDASLGSVVYEKDPVLTFYPYNHPEISDLHVKLLLPPTDVFKIKEKTKMRVYSGDEYLADARVSYSSSFVKEIDAADQAIFSNSREAVVVRMELENNLNLKGRFEIDNLPVTLLHIRTNEFDSTNVFSRFLRNFIK